MKINRPSARVQWGTGFGRILTAERTLFALRSQFPLVCSCLSPHLVAHYERLRNTSLILHISHPHISFSFASLIRFSSPPHPLLIRFSSAYHPHIIRFSAFSSASHLIRFSSHPLLIRIRICFLSASHPHHIQMPTARVVSID